MKTKRLFAALLCAAALLTGCNSSSGNSQSESASESSYSEESSSENSTTSSAESSTQSSYSSSVESSSSKVEKRVPKAELLENEITVNYEGKTMRVPFKTDIPFDPDEKYYLRIFFGDEPYEEYELRYDEPFDTSLTALTIKLHNGNNYYMIQFHTDEKKGENSNVIYQNFMPPVKHNTLKFYTFTAAMYGDAFECLFGYPNYDEADYYLAQSITPTHISVDVYYRCLICGTETYCTTTQFSYTQNDSKMISYHCDNRRCQNHSGGYTTLSSRIE